MPLKDAIQINNKYIEYKRVCIKSLGSDYNATNISNQTTSRFNNNFDLTAKKSFQIPNLELLKDLLNMLKNINILPVEGTANIFITDFPSTQLNTLLALSSSFDIKIIERN